MQSKLYILLHWRSFFFVQVFYAMSRCFPFPPPGYAKKAWIEDVGLLKKEKSHEKKHRKEKKEKEKRDRKEKKHKNRSQEKQKGNNEKKVKIRDKRDDKDKDKDTQKASDERRLLGKSETYNGGNQKHQVNDSILFEKTYSEQPTNYTEAKLIQSNHQAEKTKNPEPRLRDKEGDKFSTALSERDNKMVRLVAKSSATSLEKIKDHKVDDSKIGSLGFREDAKFSTSSMVQNSVATVRIGVEAVSKPPPLEKKDSKPSERKTEGWKKRNEELKKGNDDDKRKDKHRDKDREKKVKTKDKDRENEKKREKKMEKLDDKRAEMNASKECNNEKSISSHSLKASQLHADGDKPATLEGNFKKRKDFESNGFLHTEDIRPIKVQKLTSSGLPNPGNGEILRPCKTLIASGIERQGTANNLYYRKEGKINGVIEAPPSTSSIKPISTRQVDQMAPPHPDCRYLSQIYSLPKVEEWSDIGDQEWLSKSCNAKEKKPKSSGVEQMPLVWAEAVPIESADTCALPYVIPY